MTELLPGAVYGPLVQYVLWSISVSSPTLCVCITCKVKEGPSGGLCRTGDWPLSAGTRG